MTWNRSEDSTAASVNLDAAPHGFKVTGDAAWDPDSNDYAMFSQAGDVAVADVVRRARSFCQSWPEVALAPWVDVQLEDIGVLHPEVRDTMVRETIAYALDEGWQEAYGHRYGQPEESQP